MRTKGRGSIIGGCLALGLLGLTGCDFDRGDPYQTYDDVGELDISRYDRAYAKGNKSRAGAEKSAVAENESRKHAHEVGELSLDEGVRPRASKSKKPVPEVKEPVKPAKPVAPPAATAKPAESKPTASAKPVKTVPAPAPAPEYRAPAVAMKRPVKAQASRVDNRTYHHATNVGELELGN